MPSSASRLASFGSPGPTVTSRSTRASKRPHRSGSRISTDDAARRARPATVAGFGSGRVNGRRSRAARSRAHAGDRHRVGPVRVDLEVVEDVGLDAHRLRERRAGLEARRAGGRCRRGRRRGRARGWSRASRWTRRRPSCGGRSPCRSGMTVPTVASGTRSPAAMLNAPHPTSSGWPSPASTMTRWILLAPSIGRVLEHPGDDDAVEALADPLELLHRHAEVAHLLAERDGVALERGEVAQPGEEDLHR